MRKESVQLLAMALACLCPACAYINAYRPAWTYPAPPPQRTYYSSYRHHVHSARNHPAPRETKVAATPDLAAPATGDRPVTARPAPAPAAAAEPVTLSLAGDSGDRERAQHLLENANANLARARARQLTASEKETYERASQLATRARQALAENDCAAASSLASKASSLAAGIGSR